MFENIRVVAPGFFLIVLVLCAIAAVAYLIIYKIERAAAKRMHPSNRGMTGRNSPEFKY